EGACGRGSGVLLTPAGKGWTLYGCGNGGSNPRHAILLAEQLDSETCIKYLDRFLMYYIRTAPPLTRTAPWLEKLDGGIEYLKKGSMEGCLGTAKKRETKMRKLVDTYDARRNQAFEGK